MKVKGKKGRGKNVLVEAKKIELGKVLDIFRSQCDEIESSMKIECETVCSKIEKIYADKLKSLPENVRNMTLTEYMDMQRKIQPEESVDASSVIRSQFEKSKLESAKKTLKKSRIERKRSASTTNIDRLLMLNQSSMSKVLSESCLHTPLSKKSVAPSFVVTPKFNPKAPMQKNFMREPKAGEVLMSLSGSPVNIPNLDIHEKPGVAVSLGGGKVIKITDDTELVKLESDFLKKLDKETKITLANVKEKLEKILQA